MVTFAKSAVLANMGFTEEPKTRTPRALFFSCIKTYEFLKVWVAFIWTYSPNLEILELKAPLEASKK